MNQTYFHKVINLPPGNTVAIIGAGPAGLAAAHELIKLDVTPTIFEMNRVVGGISRTDNYKNYLFDIGGHRFFTRKANINQLWQEMMGEDFLTVAKKSRILYKNNFFDYPLKPMNALVNLGIFESVLIFLSYLHVQIFPSRREDNFEQWVANRFGWRLYKTFFKTYTEKVWGIPCDQIQADWAAQRIKGLSLKTAVINAFFKQEKAKSLIASFHYPRKGPGMMWDRFQQHIEKHGGKINLHSKVTRINCSENRITSLVFDDGPDHAAPTKLEHLISSLPITTLTKLLNPPPPDEVTKAAEALSYRSFLIVGLIVNKKNLFPDQWIYIHSPEVKVGRIQNFKNWSPEMVPDLATSSIGMEYFCDMNDDLWNLPDAELIELATKELIKLQMASENEIIDGTVIRQPLAYPVYDRDYAGNLAIIKNYLEGFANLQTIGRNGMHRYNNMDHSMQTGILSAQNTQGAQHNLWEINEEEEYLEEYRPIPVSEKIIDKLLSRSFARIDKFAFATACGTLAGLLLFIATLWLAIKGGENMGQHIQLVRQYFAGYSVSVKGAFVAFPYAFFCGFIFGWVTAYLRSIILALTLYSIKKKNEMVTIKDIIDYL